MLAETDYSPIVDDQATLDAVYAELFPPDLVKPAILPTSGKSTPELTDSAIMTLASNARNAAKFRALLAGITSGYDSPSEADAALAMCFGFYSTDAAQVERLMRESNLVRGKWDERRPGGTYLSVTIDHALRKVSEHYRGHVVPIGTKQVPGDSKSILENRSQGNSTARSRNSNTQAPVHHVMNEPTEQTGQSTSETGLIRLSDVQPEQVEWLWPSYLPLGKLTIQDGDPGLGKTTIALDIAARVSTGRAMPDGARGDLTGPAGVLLFTAEDGLADTIRPRLDAVGADVSRIAARQVIIESTGLMRMPTLADLSQMEQDIAAVDAKLVIVDPVMAYLPANVKSHVDADVRRVLAPLADLAERTGVAFLVNRHLNKAAGGNPLYRGGGSIAFTGAARSVLLAAQNPDDETGTRFVLAGLKSNLGKKPPALAYHIEGAANGSSLIVWDGASKYNADDLLAVSDPEERGALADAVAFLRDHLQDGPCKAGDVQRAAGAAGIAERTLRRAKERLKVRAERVGAITDAHWEWRLPNE